LNDTIKATRAEYTTL